MDFKKLKELNEKIIEKAIPKVEKAILVGDWDGECMDAMTDAIRNYKNLTKIEEKEDMNDFFRMKDNTKEEKVTHEKPTLYSADVKDKSDFDYCIADIIEKHGEKKGTEAILVVVSELMEDLKILNNRIYNNTMMKLRDIAH